jgi:predicted branched-subunit amino acid permease
MHDHQPVNLRRCLLLGMQAITPFLPGIIPFGLIAGLTPITLGYSWIDASLGSLFMFAGASQLAAYQLLGQESSIWVILVTVMAINLRYVLYSASMAPYLSAAPRATRLLASYGLTDQIYAVCQRDYPLHTWQLSERIAYYAGGTILLWILWQACTLTGALMGQIVPIYWSLDFMIPLTFLALALGTLKSGAHRVAAVVGTTVSWLALDAPMNLGLIGGGIAGIISGILVKRFHS